MKKILVLDDYLFGKGKEEDAQQTVYLGLNGEWRELDLTDETTQMLWERLEEFWEIARPTTSVTRTPLKVIRADQETPPNNPPDVPPIISSAPSLKPVEEMGKEEEKEYWAEFRAWCRTRGINLKTPSGSLYYPAQAKADFAVWRQQSTLTT